MKDVVIVGGGPAGSALAVLLGRRGLTVDVFEQTQFPREKPCGEGILPPGVEVLRTLGLTDDVGGRVLCGVQYHVGTQTIGAEFGDDGDGTPRIGIGQRRRVLDRVLWEAATSTPGVDVHPGTAVDQLLISEGRVVGVTVQGTKRHARWVVAADGFYSKLRRSLGREHISNPRRVGVRVHFSDVSSESTGSAIQVFLRPGYELYVTPLPDDQLLVAALASPEFANRIKRNFWAWCSQEPLLRDWLRGANQNSSLVGRTALQRSLTSGAALPHGLTFIGDAAGSADPITAGGMSLALKDAQLLAKELPEMLQGDRSAQRRFCRSQRNALRRHRLLGHGLLALSERPKLAEHACRLLGNVPSAMNALVGLVSK